MPCVWDFACTIFIHSKNNWPLMGLCQNSCYLTFCLWPLLGLTWFRLTYTHTSCTCLKIKGMSNSKDVYDPGGGFLIFISLSLSAIFTRANLCGTLLTNVMDAFSKSIFLVKVISIRKLTQFLFKKMPFAQWKIALPSMKFVFFCYGLVKYL